MAFLFEVLDADLVNIQWDTEDCSAQFVNETFPVKMMTGSDLQQIPLFASNT